MIDINELRAQVRAAHRRAGNKASRLRTSKNVEVNGTSYDPRRDITKIKKYNKAQLTNYLNQLQTFTDRRNSFVAGSGKQPIPSTMWRQYKQLEAKYNNAGKRNFDKLGDTFIPEAGMTVAERRATIQPRVVRASGEVANRPYSKVDRKPHHVNGVGGLKQLISEMGRKASKDYHPTEIQRGRKNLQAMLDVINDDTLQKRIDALSDDQFDVLWNHTDFGKNLIPGYMGAKVRAMGFTKDDIQASIDEGSHLDAANDMVTWAEQLPAKAKNNRKPKKGRR